MSADFGGDADGSQPPEDPSQYQDDLDVLLKVGFLLDLAIGHEQQC